MTLPVAQVARSSARSRRRRSASSPSLLAASDPPDARLRGPGFATASVLAAPSGPRGCRRLKRARPPSSPSSPRRSSGTCQGSPGRARSCRHPRARGLARQRSGAFPPERWCVPRRGFHFFTVLLRPSRTRAAPAHRPRPIRSRAPQPGRFRERARSRSRAPSARGGPLRRDAGPRSLQAFNDAPAIRPATRPCRRRRDRADDPRHRPRGTIWRRGVRPARGGGRRRGGARLERLRKNVAARWPRASRGRSRSRPGSPSTRLFEHSTLEGLVARADATLYAAKEAGRNKVSGRGARRPAASDVVYR